MKKFIILALALVLALSLLTACGGNSNTPSGNGGGNNTPSSTPSGNNSTTTPPPPASSDGNDTTPSGGKDEAIDILTLVGKTVDNERLVIVSNGKKDPIYGEEYHYLFLTFKDGKISQFGDAGSYYTFADQASFEKGLEKMRSIKGSNSTSLYIQDYTAFPNDWPNLTFAEIVERIESNSGQDNYSAYYDIVR